MQGQLIAGSSSVQDICNLKCIILKLVNAVTPQETVFGFIIIQAQQEPPSGPFING